MKKFLGVIYLKDTVKPGLKERFDELRKMGIKTLMCTGDNPLTAATIAKEAANMIDLDSNPTKILEVVEIGKGLLITRVVLQLLVWQMILLSILLFYLLCLVWFYLKCKF